MSLFPLLAPHGPAHGARIPTGSFRFIALDVETANAFSSSICQIGIACVSPDNRIETYSTLIDPGQDFATFNTRLHGIDAARVRGQPKFPDVLHALAPLLSRHILIQHSTFDRGAVNGACNAYGLQPPGWTWADSVRIARRAWPEFLGNGGHGLAHLKTVLGLRFDHHDAGEDARAAAQVVLKAEERTGKTFHELGFPAKTRVAWRPTTR